jgi:type IX secretion system PorP/SprF family membrane protein
MKKLVLSTAFLFAGVWAFAQQDAQFTQNMFNKLSVNPGSAGNNGGICATFLTRQQWTGFEGNPQTHLFAADARFSKHGVGLTVFQDQLGIEKSLVAKLAYAYHLNLGPGELGIGLEAGYLSKSFEDNFVAIDNPTLDPSIPNAGTSANTIDFGAGLYYSIPNQMYVGISVLHIPQGTLKDVADGANGQGALNFEQARNYYIMAGYDWDIKGDKKFILKPSILAKSDAASTQLDVNALLEYNKMFWGGVTYRVQDAIGILAGVHIGEFISSARGLKLGVAYDITTSSLGDHSSGSIEIMVKYCTNIVKPPTREVYHSVRFL